MKPRRELAQAFANIFFPALNAFALSDATLLLAVLLAPFLWSGVSPVVGYNCLVLLSFPTAATGMYFLVRTLGFTRTAAVAGGIAFAFNPYRFAHYSQLELLWTCWIPLAFWALLRVMASGSVRHGIVLGAILAAQVLTCL